MNPRREIEVWADWDWLGGARLMGVLTAAAARGREIYSFEYDPTWLAGPAARSIDPDLGLYRGPQYVPRDKDNFGLFLDSCPDRWGRVLMRRREAQLARDEGRPERNLLESDYLLGVHDIQRMGALRFRIEKDGPFLDDSNELACPPWTALRELEDVSMRLEQDDASGSPDYVRWLGMLMAPGSSLGGARPKAGVVDDRNALWIAKFPSIADEFNVGAWEAVAATLAARSGIEVPLTRLTVLDGRRHTFLSKRFDRTDDGRRRHFASAMTLLNRVDGQDESSGASYLELAELLMRSGARPNQDLEQLFRRIVFSICVSNTDDHLRNHGFILQPTGWSLSPAYDINPVPHAQGLRLNINESDNRLDLELAMDVAAYFRLAPGHARDIANDIVDTVGTWRKVATKHGIGRDEQARMSSAFMHANRL